MSDTEAAQAEEVEVVTYRSGNSPSLKVHLGRDENRNILTVKFVNGVLTLTDKNLIDRMDKSIAAGLGQQVQRVDIEAGLAIAEAHKASILKREQIAKGSTTSGHLKHEEVRAPEQALEAALMNPERQSEFAQDPGVLKEITTTEIVPPPPGSDEITKIEPEPEPENPEPAENKQPGNNTLADMLK